ncbi:MAG: hypothetical protein KJ574_01395, partial [Nanoarchaeota archaeon]|nr:hypothetical protein [Nanoarchaeota archaeon]
MKKMKVDTENIFYVHLSEPVEIRKSILESSRQAVRLLQRYESIIELRVKKTEQINNLRKNFRELTLLINKLKQEMPKVNVRVKSKEEFISSPPKSAEHKKKA